MWSLLVARMSRQISYDPMARRVMSSRPGPAALRRGGPPSLSETVAARAVEASCARCEVNETTRSCSSASSVSTCAPMRLSHMRNSSAAEVWSSASSSGVRIQVRPRKRSAEGAGAEQRVQVVNGIENAPDGLREEDEVRVGDSGSERSAAIDGAHGERVGNGSRGTDAGDGAVEARLAQG